MFGGGKKVHPENHRIHHEKIEASTGSESLTDSAAEDSGNPQHNHHHRHSHDSGQHHRHSHDPGQHHNQKHEHSHHNHDEHHHHNPVESIPHGSEIAEKHHHHNEHHNEHRRSSKEHEHGNHHHHDDHDVNQLVSHEADNKHNQLIQLHHAHDIIKTDKTSESMLYVDESIKDKPHDHHAVDQPKDLTVTHSTQTPLPVLESTPPTVIELKPILEPKPEVRDQPVVTKLPPSFNSDSTISELPPPYWEAKLAKNTELFIELNKIPNMKQFLYNNISIVEQLMKHPDIAREIIRDRQLATKIMDRPLLVQEMIDVKPYLNNTERRKDSVGVKRVTLNKDHYHGPDHKVNPITENKEVKHLKDKIPDNARRSSISSISSDMENGAKLIEPSTEPSSEITFASRATFPFDAKISHNSPPAIKYLADSARIFLTHHIEILDGTTACCDKKRIYYDIVDAYGRLLYRAYEAPLSCGSKVADIVIREPDDTELIIMQKRFGIFKKKIEIYCPPGIYIGCVEKKSSICSPSMFHIKNADGDTTLILRALKHYKAKRYRTEFELRTFGDHNSIGQITGEWLDLPPGGFPSNLVYGATFPKELNCNVKIGVMTAWFFIYKLYFDGSLRREIRHDLTQSEKEMIRYVEDAPEDAQGNDQGEKKVLMDLEQEGKKLPS